MIASATSETTAATTKDSATRFSASRMPWIGSFGSYPGNSAHARRAQVSPSEGEDCRSPAVLIVGPPGLEPGTDGL